MKIAHNETYLDEGKAAVRIPMVEEVREIQPKGDFILLEDPKKTERTAIMGMFVLRPAREHWKEPMEEGRIPESIYGVKHWVYNLDTVSGGAPIAAGNLMDGFRLGLQYAISDAVMVGSSTILNDGVPKEDGRPGYMWLPYNCANWPHLKGADPKMEERFTAQRKKMQHLEYASDREYPAQIVVTQSGKETSPDLLDASIFHENHPNGRSVEAYIVTGSGGAEAIRGRAGRYGLASRIEEILIELPVEGEPYEIDLKELPSTLYKEYDIRLANHDGGAKVLESFCRAGIIPQFNFTFARKPSLYESISGSAVIPEEEKPRVLKDFDSLTVEFFRTEDGSMPRSFSIAQVISDEPDEAAVVVLDTRRVKSFA